MMSSTTGMMNCSVLPGAQLVFKLAAPLDHVMPGSSFTSGSDRGALASATKLPRSRPVDIRLHEDAEAAVPSLPISLGPVTRLDGGDLPEGNIGTGRTWPRESLAGSAVEILAIGAFQPHLHVPALAALEGNRGGLSAEAGFGDGEHVDRALQPVTRGGDAIDR